MTKQLTEKQQAFLDALFGEAEGNPAKALKIAGYAQGESTGRVMAPLKEEIAERTVTLLQTMDHKLFGL